jgi:hypothetical protein
MDKARVRKDVQRLIRMAEKMEAEEARKQAIYGDASKGSIRGSAKLDAKALRSVLASLEAK